MTRGRSTRLVRWLSAAVAALFLLPAQAQFGSVARSFATDFEETLEGLGVPGGAYAVVHDGRILALETFGHTDLDRTRRIDPNTVFRIASLSKGFSGVLAAMLANEQRFELAQPVANFVPSFRIRRPARPLTVEDVLGQRSGFVRNAYDNLIEAGIEREEIIPRFNTLEPLCAPGECYSYQNNVFSLVEDVIRETTGDDFSRVLEQRLLRPLGMAGASVGFEPFRTSVNRAEPHLKTRRGWVETRPRTTYYQVASAAGINAGILDMAQWALAMLGHRQEVVPDEIIDQVLQPRIRTRSELDGRNWRGALDDAWYGLGWRIYDLPDHRLALHAGWVAGYRAEIALSRELDLGIVMLSNAETRAVGALNRRFWDAAFRAWSTANRPAPGSSLSAPAVQAGSGSDG